MIPWILIIDFQSFCLGKSSTSTELGLLHKLIVHSHLHLYIIHLHSHLHKVLRHFLMTETDGNPPDWEMWKRFEKLDSDFKFPRRRMQLGRREV